MLKKIINKNNSFTILILLLLYALALSLRYYEGLVNCLNTTAFAFSYKYGFKSRGFMGTVLRILNMIFPQNLMSYKGILVFSVFLDIVFIAVLFVFYHLILKESEKKYTNIIAGLIFIFSTFAFPHFLTEENLGRTDVCLAILTIIGIVILFYGRFEFILVLLSGLSVCIHQGYVLMFFNVFLVILFVRIIEKDRPVRNIIILALSLAISSLLFIYLNFFSHGNGSEIYDEIYSLASNLAYDGAVHRELMMHEVLGESPFSDEWKYHVINFKESAVLFVLFFPYILIAIKFFSRCIKSAVGKYKWKYLAIAFGAATILPDVIFKIDYGRWLFCVMFYYFVIILYYTAKNDKIITENLIKTKNELSNYKIVFWGLLIYPVLFTPLGDWKMTEISINILKFLGQGGNVL